MDRRQVLRGAATVGAISVIPGCNLGGGSDGEDGDTATPTPTDGQTPTATDGSTPTATDGSTPTATDGSTPTATATDGGTPTDTPTATDVGTVPESALPDQALPTFDEPAENLHTTNPNSNHQDVLVSTLQGIVNREQPRIYIPRGGTVWQTAVDLSIDFMPVWDLVENYIDDVEGVVAYDPEGYHSINVATTIAGVEDAVAARPRHATHIRDEYGVEIVEDLQALDVDFGEPDTAYRWMLDNYGDQTTDELMVSLPPVNAGSGGDPFAIFRDYAVATEATVLYVDTQFGEERELFLEAADSLSTPAACMGWFLDEVAAVQTCSKQELFVAPADFFRSGSFWAGTGPKSASEIRELKPDRPEPPALDDKVYVTFTLTEGDNLQYCQGALKNNWEDSARGDVPINWSISPLLRDIGPAMLEYFYETATENDHFMCGPSGLGYAYTKDWPEETVNEFVGLSGNYMEALDLETIYMLNRVGVHSTISDRVARLFEQETDPLGIALGWDGPNTETKGDNLVTSHGIVGLKETNPTPDNVLAAIEDNVPDDWDSNPRPAFLSVGLFGFVSDPSLVKSVVGQLDDRFEVVRGDTYFQLAESALE